MSQTLSNEMSYFHRPHSKVQCQTILVMEVCILYGIAHQMFHFYNSEERTVFFMRKSHESSQRFYWQSNSSVLLSDLALAPLVRSITPCGHAQIKRDTTAKANQAMSHEPRGRPGNLQTHWGPLKQQVLGRKAQLSSPDGS